MDVKCLPNKVKIDLFLLSIHDINMTNKIIQKQGD